MPSSLAFFDSHCHLDFAAFDADRDAVWQRAQALGVSAAFLPGVRPEQWQRLAKLTRSHPEWRLGVGLHPYFLHEQSPAALTLALESLREQALQCGATAIGECGLDARLPQRGGFSLDEQERALVPQVQIAKELHLPLVVHVVGAHGRALRLFESLGPFPHGAVLHSYSGSAELVPRYARLGFSFGFGSALTQPHARKVRLALKAVPLSRLLFETDAPDQPTHNAREVYGNEARNEPAALLEVATAAAQILGNGSERTLHALARVTTRNARGLFCRTQSTPTGLSMLRSRT